jgi:porphobilinogen synthase
VYHVSGEYAMLKAAAERGWLNEKEAALEALMCFRRCARVVMTTITRWLTAAASNSTLE